MAARADNLHRKSPAALRSSVAVRSASAASHVRTRSLFSFYAHALEEFFRAPGRRGTAFLFFVATGLHSFGHAALAVLAGRCAVLLVEPRDAGATKELRTALLLGSVGLAAAVAKAAGGAAASYGQTLIAARVGGTLRLAVLDAWFARYGLRRARQPDHGQASTTPPTLKGAAVGAWTTARGVTALTVQVREIENGLASGLLGGGRALAQLVPLTAALVWISPRLAVAALLVLAPFGLALSRLRRAWKTSLAAATREGEDLLEAADEAVRHADLWVAYSAEGKARRAVERLGALLGLRKARLQLSAAAMSGGNEVLGALALVVALAAAGAGLLGDVGSGGRLLGFTVCFFLAYRPIRDLTEARLAWSRAATAFSGLVGDESDRPRETPAPANTSKTPWPLADLRVQGLALRHGTSAPVSFALRAGEVLVVVGPTGEGKTTLLRTLLGLESSDAGDVLYGGRSLLAAPPGLNDRPFAWVPQDTPLLADTLEANVTLADDAPPGQAAETLRILGAAHLERVTGDARLGPGGVMVSGGERQWIALARALSTAQPVLLLDEPTSGLDAASQRNVLAAIAALRGRRSVIVVTHRPEPRAIADVVVHMEDAKVRVEDGPMRIAAGSSVRADGVRASLPI